MGSYGYHKRHYMGDFQLCIGDHREVIKTKLDVLNWLFMKIFI